jgi:hypothetical protein
MGNLDGAFSTTVTDGSASDGCAGTWCEFYVTEDLLTGNVHLWVVKNADGDTDTVTAAEGETGNAALEITRSTRLDTIGAMNTGVVVKTVTLNDLEKLPTLVEDRLAQSSGNNEGFADNFMEAQNLITQFRVYSGPNVHSEEGADPYAWVICGSRGQFFGETACNLSDVAMDSGAAYAIVYNSNNQNNTLGDSVLARFGRDLNPNRYDGGTGDNQSIQLDVNGDVVLGSGDPSQQSGVYVACVLATDCLSDPGVDLMYGTSDDGTIYYREALENGLRGWIRETNAHTFSFLGADNDGLSKSETGNVGPNFGLTQLVTQETEGFLMSCLGCSPHSLPAVVETVTYQLDWPAVPTAIQVSHPPTSPTSTFSIVP